MTHGVFFGTKKLKNHSMFYFYLELLCYQQKHFLSKCFVYLILILSCLQKRKEKQNPTRTFLLVVLIIYIRFIIYDSLCMYFTHTPGFHTPYNCNSVVQQKRPGTP